MVLKARLSLHNPQVRVFLVKARTQLFKLNQQALAPTPSHSLLPQPPLLLHFSKHSLPRLAHPCLDKQSQQALVPTSLDRPLLLLLHPPLQQRLLRLAHFLVSNPLLLLLVPHFSSQSLQQPWAQLSLVKIPQQKPQALRTCLVSQLVLRLPVVLLLQLLQMALHRCLDRGLPPLAHHYSSQKQPRLGQQIFLVRLLLSRVLVRLCLGNLSLLHLHQTRPVPLCLGMHLQVRPTLLTLDRLLLRPRSLFSMSLAILMT